MKLKTTARLVLGVLAPLAMISRSVLADEPVYYGTHLSMGGYYQNDPSSGYGLAEGFIPMWQAPDSILFADIRGFNRVEHQLDGNFGMGLRHIVGDDKDGGAFLWGAYGFYDVVHSTEQNIFHQITLGGELKTDAWVADANVYLPVGDRVQDASSLDSSELRPAQTAGYQNVWYRDGTETLMSGLDAELGLHIAYVPQLTAYLGGYYYQAPQTPSILGPRLRLNYDWINPFNLDQNWRNVFPQLSFQGEVQDDKQRGAQWYVGMTLRIGIGSQPEMDSTGVTKDMTDDVQRSYDVVTTDKMLPYQELNNAKGTAENVWVVNNNDDWNSTQNSALRSGADVIWLQGDLTNINNFSLGNNQTLMAGNYNFNADGRSFSIASADQNPVTMTQAGNQTGAAATDPFITVDQNDTIEGLNITVANPFTNIAIANKSTTDGQGNVTGQSVGNFSLFNDDINGAVILNVNDASHTSNITIANDMFNSQYTGTGADTTKAASAANPVGALSIIAGANTTVNVSAISDNDFYVAGNYAAGILNEVDGDGGAINYLSGIDGNQINVTGIDGDAAGIENYVANNIKSGQITIPTGITNNQAINVNALGDGNAYGIYNLLDGINSTLSIGDIGDNSSISAASSANAYGILNEVKGTGSNLTVASIQDNGLISAMQNSDASATTDSASAIANAVTAINSHITITDGIINNQQILAAANGAGVSTAYGIYNNTDASGSTITMDSISGNSLVHAVNDASGAGSAASDILNKADSSTSFGATKSGITITNGINDNILYAEATGVAVGIGNTADGDLTSIVIGGTGISGNSIVSKAATSYGIENAASGTGSLVDISAISGNGDISATGTAAASAISNTASTALNNSANGIEIDAIDSNANISATDTGAGSAAAISNNSIGYGSNITIGDILNNENIVAEGMGGSIYGIYNTASNAAGTAGQSNLVSTILIKNGINNNTITATDTSKTGATGTVDGIDSEAGSYGDIELTTIAANTITADSATGAGSALSANGIVNTASGSNSAVSISQGITANTIAATGASATGIANTVSGANSLINLQVISANKITATGNGVSGNTYGINNTVSGAGTSASALSEINIVGGITENDWIEAIATDGASVIAINNTVSSAGYGEINISTISNNGSPTSTAANNGIMVDDQSTIAIPIAQDAEGINNAVSGTNNKITIGDISSNVITVKNNAPAGNIIGIDNQELADTNSITIDSGINSNTINLTNSSTIQSVNANPNEIIGIKNDANGATGSVTLDGVDGNTFTITDTNINDAIEGMWNNVGTNGTVNVGLVNANTFDITANASATSVFGINNTGTGTIDYANAGSGTSSPELLVANSFTGIALANEFLPATLPTGLVINWGASEQATKKK